MEAAGTHVPAAGMTGPVGGPRARSLRSRLLAAGLTDTDRALRLLEEPALGAFDSDALITALAATADPDLALLTLLRLLTTCDADRRYQLEDLLRLALLPATQAPDDAHEHLRRLLAVLGASRALGDVLVTHPALLARLRDRKSVV